MSNFETVRESGGLSLLGSKHGYRMKWFLVMSCTPILTDTYLCTYIFICAPAIFYLHFDLFKTHTMCPRSSDPFYICKLLHKMGHYTSWTHSMSLISAKNFQDRSKLYWYALRNLLSVPKVTANLYCICLSILHIYTWR